MRKFLYFLQALLSAFLLAGCTSVENNNATCTIAWIVIAAIIIFFFVMAKITNILRDEIGDCPAYEKKVQETLTASSQKDTSIKRPYSLSRTQLAVWTTVISCTYIYEVLCVNCKNININTTALILMGISTGTIAVAGLIDKNQIEQDSPRHQDEPSKGFFTDILSDDNGISIHRFQNSIWTIIAIIVYLHHVFNQQLQAGTCFPELDQTLLALTGISSATYLTLKGKENTNPAVKP
ncbi:hypothetical protein [Mucilaginibacter arboris]|uniref:Lipoprotein n=1 Tax=Mucilaginibacter arboris TaxID=2682090 RepID=A0A7K1SZH8_9SPHI|nr:hypothetical protein [Mucilaginibacter arboris]MVN22450.1 hypothetical protein [Mucilaginibacter arboris]